MDLLVLEMLRQTQRYENLIASPKWVAPWVTELPLAATANGDGVADDFLQGFGAETEAPDPPTKEPRPQPEGDKKDETESNQDRATSPLSSLRTQEVEVESTHGPFGSWRPPALRILLLGATGVSGALAAHSPEA